jgi:hypothetical protein
VVFLAVTVSPTWNCLRQLGGKERIEAVTRAFEAVRQDVFEDLLAGKFCPRENQLRADYAVNVTGWQKRGLPHVHMIAHFPGAMDLT